MKKPTVSFSLRWKLIAVITLLVVALTTGLTYFYINSQQKILDSELQLRINLNEEKLISRGRAIANNLSNQVQNGLATVNLSHISEILAESVRKDPELYYAILADSSGRAYIHTLKPELELDILQQPEDQFALEKNQPFSYQHDQFGATVIEFIAPIRISAEPWGVLRLGFSKDGLNREITEFQKDHDLRLQTLIKRSIYIACAFLSISTAILLIMADRLSRPIRKLTLTVDNIAAGDFNAAENLKIKSRDEIGVLASAFVHMSRQLQLSYKRLQNHNQILEEKVNERTLELAAARDEAIKANHSKSDFLSMISHEIRTPMNAIMGLTELVLKTELNTKQRDFLSKVKFSADALLVIINDLLDMSKIEAGQLNIENVDFDLEEVLSYLNTMVGIKAEEKNLELHFLLANEVPIQLRGDPLRLGQVLLNLVGNAVKFTEAGDIVVKVALAEGQAADPSDLMLRFSVKDTGIGMSREQIKHLFKPFTQVDSSITRLYGGTGLGLSICKQLVELMGGSIHVESEPGAGAEFIFTVRVKRAGEETAARPMNPVLNTKGLKVLVVDDNAAARDILATYLTSFNVELCMAGSGEEAVRILERNEGQPISLVLMDWKMPYMTGIEAARQIKESKKIKRVPTILMVTAHAKEEIMSEVQQLGLDDVLVKPVNPSCLYNAVIGTLQKNPPIAAENGNKEQAPGNSPRDEDARPKILVVDDFEINRQVAKAMLEGGGYQVSLADNGEQAVQMVKTNRFDAVLMDLQMPVMDGYEATRQIRSEQSFTALPIIALTAHATEEEKNKCLERGMQDCIGKPIDLKQLLTSLRQAVEPEMLQPSVAGESAKELADSRRSGHSALDVNAGIGNVSGKRRLYLKLLKNFQHQFNDFARQIRASLRANDRDGSQQLIHGLKGVAGNIAAFDLSDKTALLERAIAEGQDLEMPLLDLERALQAVFADIDALTRSEQFRDGDSAAGQDEIKVHEVDRRASSMPSQCRDDRPRILIVDDIPINTEILEGALTDQYTVLIANNGDDAMLKAISVPPPDLILLDINMPGMNGYDILRKLQGNELTQKIPVIFITARTDTEDEEIGFKLGAVDYIAKPFKIPVIQARVNNQIKIKQQSERLEQLANLDGLTGIPNRRQFEKVLQKEWHRARRSQKPLSVIFIDIDFFKKFNDTYGHAVGDECLIAVAKTLKKELKRCADFIARYGGEEFVAILPETDGKAAFALAEAMRISAAKIQLSDLVLPQPSITLSLGVSTAIPGNGMKPEDLINAADRALYQAKHNGRNQVKEKSVTVAV
ncbi:response regulator [Methylomarinum vadi]|uniref:response regulator n=1 Tax=Methylomarinum vadi TaxID=438855 RepID=UPI00068EB130|nr:response regulator [Methylomarinum vadi]